ncbi:MAG: MaoC family dehydratase [Phenylobacterium sp.]|uniref:MaoC family dehydratase n=1 Tax=Phenylobacterium sp. TaxID=1871053 RepID=UPI003918CCD2
MSAASLQDTVLSLPLDAEVGVSEWVLVDQDMVDAFGAATRDPDPMHVDPAWAAANGPFGGTIAFGFLTVSLLTHLLHSALRTQPNHEAAGQGYYLNYGFDRLRFVAPVPTGSRIRGRFTKLRQVQDEKGRWLTSFGCVVEIEGAERPALVADWLSLWVPPAETH